MSPLERSALREDARVLRVHIALGLAAACVRSTQRVSRVFHPRKFYRTGRCTSTTTQHFLAGGCTLTDETVGIVVQRLKLI